MNILITNCVPLNGGDEALLRALILSLKANWPDTSVNALCNDVELTRQYLPDLRIGADLEFATGAALRESSSLYRQADIVLSAPGGFLHDYYPLEDRLRGFEVALALGKPVVLLGQSLGPFWKPESLRRIPEVLNRVSCICVRDGLSKQHLLEAGVAPSGIRATADVAFLWRRLAPELFCTRQSPTGKVGLCFRAWPLGDTVAVKDTIAKAVELCHFLLKAPERQLLFVSTCQGIPGYVDDSELAADIRRKLPLELQDRCRVSRARLGPRELMAALGECDAFIGMRLHACLLAMLAGCPAMGLGYEKKTSEIFQQLGLEPFQASFDSDLENWLRCARQFLAETTRLRARLPQILDQACDRAELNLDPVRECLAPDRRGSAPRSKPPDSEWKDLTASYDLPHLRLRQVVALLKQVAPPQLLDLGCATGQLRHLCPEVEYIGCDFVPPKTPPPFPFYQCDFNRQLLPADLRELEAITCSGLLEYINDLPRFLAQLHSRLKPGGHLIATYFNMNHVSRVAALLRGKTFPVRPDWRGFYSPPDFKRLISEAGFDILRSVAMNHSLRTARPVGETVSCALKLGAERPWSVWLAHHILLVARARALPAVGSPVALIMEFIPAGSRFILVDEAHWSNQVFDDRRPVPFLEKDGQYWGLPEDDATAIRECERLRQVGASFIVFAPHTFWWLKHYARFGAHLRSHFRIVVESDSVIIFDLRHGP